MSTTSENILKSLAVLEQNLKEINSANYQVNTVVKSSKDLAEVIETYQSSFDGISNSLQTVLNEVKSVNLDTISALSKQTELFNNEVAKLSNLDIEKSFTSAKSETIKQFEKDLRSKLFVVDDYTIKFKEEVVKLTEFDFSKSFQTIEREVVKQFNKDLQGKLIVLDRKAQDLQEKIDEFKNLILRLESFDLTTHFDKISTELSKKLNQQEVKLNEKYEGIKNQNEILIKRFDQQDKEMKLLKMILFVICGVLAIGVVVFLRKFLF